VEHAGGQGIESSTEKNGEKIKKKEYVPEGGRDAKACSAQSDFA
jgi:hypothetical protein